MKFFSNEFICESLQLKTRKKERKKKHKLTKSKERKMCKKYIKKQKLSSKLDRFEAIVICFSCLHLTSIVSLMADSWKHVTINFHVQ